MIKHEDIQALRQKYFLQETRQVFDFKKTSVKQPTRIEITQDDGVIVMDEGRGQISCLGFDHALRWSFDIQTSGLKKVNDLKYCAQERTVRIVDSLTQKLIILDTAGSVIHEQGLPMDVPNQIAYVADQQVLHVIDRNHVDPAQSGLYVLDRDGHVHTRCPWLSTHYGGYEAGYIAYSPVTSRLYLPLAPIQQGIGKIVSYDSGGQCPEDVMDIVESHPVKIVCLDKGIVLRSYHYFYFVDYHHALQWRLPIHEAALSSLCAKDNMLYALNHLEKTLWRYDF